MDRHRLCDIAKHELQGELVDTPPLPCDFKVGDKVIFTNYYGVEFENTVFGFARQPHYVRDCEDLYEPRFVYVHADAWWFPVRASSLRHA